MSHQPGDENAPRNTPDGGGTPQYGQHETGGSSYGAHRQEPGAANQGPPQYNPQNSGHDAAPSYQGQAAGYNDQYGGQKPGRPAGWGLGLASLICGIVGLVFSWLVVPGIAAIVAIILGIVAIRKLKKTPGAGKAMPIVGIITGALGTIAAIVVAILSAVLFSYGMDAYEQCSHLQSDNAAFEQCLDDYANSNS
ncbi:DUF4190 domain-containing protein [Rothia sp. AR01]|uniref:DUF4190 domain-containing protein n=1 Tax=Rothia santali TaxID=2949643 RepID=A0A9X2HCU6_9MICC|nr:DUF4190 domain-containing protein [Rothia santali]MCP3425925.1 DUF4190 domain-containing protein [Rothia santali]